MEEIAEENLQDLDDEGLDIADEQAPKPTKVLRLKVDQATRWGSVYNMLQRLVVLRVQVETWYVRHGKEATATRLTDEQWECISDLVDVLGVFKDFTLLMQGRDVDGVVHLLPQLLRILCNQLVRPAKYASRFSGRSLDDYGQRCEMAGEQDVTKLVTPLQKRAIDIIM